MTNPKSANPQGGKNIQGQGTQQSGKNLGTGSTQRPNLSGGANQQGGFNKGQNPTAGKSTGTGTGNTGSKTGGQR